MSGSFTEKIIWLWQNVERVLVVLFFATFTLNIRKVFLMPYSFLNGRFNEYLTMSFSWADLLMIAVIIIYTIKIIISQFNWAGYRTSVYKHKFSILSILSSLPTVSYETIFFLFFLAWAGLSIFWSVNSSIALYRFAVLLELTLFSLVIIKVLGSRKWLTFAIWALVLNGLFQSILGISQFIRNGSLGLSFWGESILGPNMPGVAKVIFDGIKHIRAYGTLPHPNILAGFLIVPIFFLAFELLLRSHIVSRETIFRKTKASLLLVLLVIISIGFILTFSRSAFLGSFFGLLVFTVFFVQKRKILPTICQSSVFKNFTFSIFLIFTLIIALSFSTYLLINHSSFFSGQSLEERGLYSKVSREIISIHPTRGVGLGQFIFEEYHEHPQLEYWQYQPVHNLYLLIFSELGVVGFIIFLLFLTVVLLDSTRGVPDGYKLTNIIIYCIIINFLFISFFDHYFWDIKIGTIILFLPFLLIKLTSPKNQKSL